MNSQSAKYIIETALLTSQVPIKSGDLKKLFDDQIDDNEINNLVDELKKEWEHRGLEIVSVASGFRFQSKREFSKFIDKLKPEKNVRYSRAVMETIAIIAYRQPVTRGDIENIRGVAVSTNIIKTLEERNWIKADGFRNSVGKPVIFVTTKNFLDDLGLVSLDELPEISFDDEFEKNFMKLDKGNYEAN